MTRVEVGPVTIRQPPAEILLGWGFILAIQAALLGAYLVARDVSPTFFHLAPFVWINVGLWAFLRTRPPSVVGRRRLIAASIAIGYFLLVSYVGGLYGIHPSGHGRPVTGWEIRSTLPPGYGPAIFYVGDGLRLAIVPYLVVGYAAIAYLVYVTVLDASRSVAGGVFGLIACVGCAWPIIAPIVAAVIGGGAVLTTATYEFRYEVSTIAFLAAIAFLVWRPMDR
ncbi:DUF7546 family protein [Halovivax gelatinilyticus]|uniref:DUF7546 family protein n=1 Tax=Halovivax gelatinilyticus TaxID=2961597 RepID=UPI0020CA68C5|nr:hypothetical protein [Halovivax gelatinilyticus]